MVERLEYENAVRIIREVIGRSEADFQRKNGRFPSLVTESDYILLTDHLNIREMSKKYGHTEDSGEVLPGHDISFVLMRNYLEREGFFQNLGEENRINAFNGFMGVLDYRPSEKEYRIRIDALNKLRDVSEDFPRDFQEFLKRIKNISKRCSVNSLTGIDRAEKEMAYRNNGTHLVNPSAQLYRWLSGRRGKDFDSLIKLWEEHAQDAREYPEVNSYK